MQTENSTACDEAVLQFVIGLSARTSCPIDVDRTICEVQGLIDQARGSRTMPTVYQQFKDDLKQVRSELGKPWLDPHDGDRILSLIQRLLCIVETGVDPGINDPRRED